MTTGAAVPKFGAESYKQTSDCEPDVGGVGCYVVLRPERSEVSGGGLVFEDIEEDAGGDQHPAND